MPCTEVAAAAVVVVDAVAVVDGGSDEGDCLWSYQTTSFENEV